ncbi:MAG: ATP-binding protein [Clostridiales bacterium]|nr:ATP-binding protein [Clostridiales bacterium]
MRGVMAVVGSRQTGKSTLIKHLSTTQNHKEISLDNLTQREMAQTQPEAFIGKNRPPLFIDEVQYAAQLFPYMKMYVDKTHEKGAYYISGSQRFNMMKNLSESLAGRVGIFELMGLSMRELTKTAFCEPFVPAPEYFNEREKEYAPMDYNEIWRFIHRGAYPELHENPSLNWESYYNDYVNTYIERDVHQLENVGDEIKFLQFMRVVAANSGNLLNIDGIAKDVGIKRDECEKWLSVLRASNLIFLLPPYHSNVMKRAVKTPKIYFLDTGLMAFLTRWMNVEQLEIGAMSGAFFETFVFCEILKSFHNKGKDPRNYLYFYRDIDGGEIDLVINNGGLLHPVEIKKGTRPDKKDTASFKRIEGDPVYRRGGGGIICMHERLTPLNEIDYIIPVQYI